MRVFHEDDKGRAKVIEAAVTKFDPKEDRTRHELTAEADINQLLRRYLPHELPVREAFYGERDFSLDAHDAMIAREEARLHYVERANSDPSFAKVFPTFGAFVDAEPEVVAQFEARPAAEPSSEPPEAPVSP